MKQLLSGNEAIARGAWEAGVNAAFGYPGTPSTEILETLVKLPGPYCEWSVNEKVALESAAGAAECGARTMVTMKHVGLNVASDPMMTLSYIGTVGGMLILVADDPGQHSSQTEQDTRHYARFSKLPVLEPADAGECLDFVKRGFDLSEKYGCPVIVRLTTCVSHSRFLVNTSERTEHSVPGFEPDPAHFVPLPLWGRNLRCKVEDRMAAQAKDASDSIFNTEYRRGSALGIISSGVTALHCLEAFPDASLLKLGWAWPFPDDLILRFAKTVKEVVVIEEADPILEEHVKSLGIACRGKDIVPRCGELTPDRIAEVKAVLEGKKSPVPAPFDEAADLPARPPILCAGCPHRGIFYGLAQFDVTVTGDIGCYSLGVFPPLSRTDILLCMGGGFTLAHGMSKVGGGKKKPVVGIVGDSTFFHSGITGLINLVWNKGDATLIVTDNHTTAMTGHQDHPGTGRTLMGEPALAFSIEKIAEACGIEKVRIVNPYDQKQIHEVLQEELYSGKPSLIISRAPCVLKEKTAVKPALKIDHEKCRNCRKCLKSGCPALESSGMDQKPVIGKSCTGCTLCKQICPFGAIS